MESTTKVELREAGINVHDVLPVTTPRGKQMMPPADRIYDPRQGAKNDLTDTGDDFLAIGPALRIMQLNVEGLSAAFEVTTIDANATSLPDKVLFYVKIHVPLCGFFATLRESSKRLCGILTIICEILWLNGCFTSSAIITHSRRARRPLSSSISVVVACCHPSSFLSSTVLVVRLVRRPSDFSMTKK